MSARLAAKMGVIVESAPTETVLLAPSAMKPSVPATKARNPISGEK
jgi:hypothetical protein